MALKRPKGHAGTLVVLEHTSSAEGHAIMNLCMAATYDPDPRAPLGFRIPFNAEFGEAIAERWRNWRRHDPIKLIAKYRDNLKSLRGIYIDCGWCDQYTSTTARDCCRSGWRRRG